MSKVAIKGANTGTGTFTIESPATNTDRTLSLPDASGTILTTATPGVPVNGPAFIATAAGTQSVTSAVSTKILFATELYDTNLCFDSSRFTPTVAGFYQINITLFWNAGVPGELAVILYKNGSVYRQLTDIVPTTGFIINGSSLVYLNGSTDYVEVYGYQAAGAVRTVNALSSFDGFLARSAT